jgi:hypothetical protein
MDASRMPPVPDHLNTLLEQEACPSMAFSEPHPGRVISHVYLWHQERFTNEYSRSTIADTGRNAIITRNYCFINVECPCMPFIKEGESSLLCKSTQGTVPPEQRRVDFKRR